MPLSGLILLALIVGAHAWFLWRVTQVFRFVNLGQGTLGFDEFAAAVGELSDALRMSPYVVSGRSEALAP